MKRLQGLLDQAVQQGEAGEAHADAFRKAGYPRDRPQPSAPAAPAAGRPRSKAKAWDPRPATRPRLRSQTRLNAALVSPRLERPCQQVPIRRRGNRLQSILPRAARGGYLPPCSSLHSREKATAWTLQRLKQAGSRGRVEAARRTRTPPIFGGCEAILPRIPTPHAWQEVAGQGRGDFIVSSSAAASRVLMWRRRVGAWEERESGMIAHEISYSQPDGLKSNSLKPKERAKGELHSPPACLLKLGVAGRLTQKKPPSLVGDGGLVEPLQGAGCPQLTGS